MKNHKIGIAVTTIEQIGRVCRSPGIDYVEIDLVGLINSGFKPIKMKDSLYTIDMAEVKILKKQLNGKTPNIHMPFDGYVVAGEEYPFASIEKHHDPMIGLQRAVNRLFVALDCHEGICVRHFSSVKVSNKHVAVEFPEGEVYQNTNLFMDKLEQAAISEAWQIQIAFENMAPGDALGYKNDHFYRFLNGRPLFNKVVLDTGHAIPAADIFDVDKFVMEYDWILTHFHVGHHPATRENMGNYDSFLQRFREKGGSLTVEVGVDHECDEVICYTQKLREDIGI